LSASAPSSHDLSLAAFTINIAESNFRHTQETFGDSAPQFAKLSKHLMSKYIDGETDEHRLTVHGLSFLRDFDRERNLS